MERKSSEVTSIVGVRVEVEDSFSGGGGSGGKDGLGQSSANDNEVKGGWINERVLREVGHVGEELDEGKNLQMGMGSSCYNNGLGADQLFMVGHRRLEIRMDLKL